MLVFCSHRGVSLVCKHCPHAVAHRIEKISFSGPFTCDGGQKCTAPIAEETNGLFGTPEVWGGEKLVGEVKCVPVAGENNHEHRTCTMPILRKQGLIRPQGFWKAIVHRFMRLLRLLS